MEIKGKLLQKGATQEFGDKGFKVAKFQIDLTSFNPNTGDEYPNKAEFQITGDKTALLDPIAVGSKIEIGFNVRGRDVAKKDGTGNVFIQNLEAFKITVLEEGVATAATEKASTPAAGKEDDLPF